MRGRSERRRGPAAARGLVATRRTTEENRERTFPGKKKIWLKLECEQPSRPIVFVFSKSQLGLASEGGRPISVCQLVRLD